MYEGDPRTRCNSDEAMAALAGVSSGGVERGNSFYAAVSIGSLGAGHTMHHSPQADKGVY